MNILITAATQLELNLIQQKLKSTKNNNISYLVTGIGMLQTAVSLCVFLNNNKPDWVIQIGIAGHFSDKCSIGDVVIIEKEYLGDLGVEEDNKWIDIFEMGFTKKSKKPFSNKALVNKNIKIINTKLPIVSGLTINQITSSKKVAERLHKKYKVEAETMEGAALHYIGNILGIKYLQVRAISNKVSVRDKKYWKMNLALKNLSNETKKLVHKL